MRKLKLYFILLSFIFLSGCFQSSALLGPGMTIISTGNVAQAGFHYGANTAIKKETVNFPSYISKKLLKPLMRQIAL